MNQLRTNVTIYVPDVDVGAILTGVQLKTEISPGSPLRV